tara:strand:+ start:204 stop:326 length:123 start_codon:yes stop_codon:yes gene_type:complete
MTKRLENKKGRAEKQRKNRPAHTVWSTDLVRNSPKPAAGP